MHRQLRNFPRRSWPISLPRSLRSMSGTGWASPSAGPRRHGKRRLRRRRRNLILTRFLYANRYPPRTASGAGFRSKTLRSILGAFLGVGTDHGLRRGMRHSRGGCRSDLAPASADRTVIGRDQRDVGIDPEPAVAREHLHIEMQMAAGPVGMGEGIRNHAAFLAFLDATAVENAVGIHGGRLHVHIAKADMFVAGIDLQRRGLLLQRADHDAIADGNDRLLVGFAAIAAVVARRTWRRADILSLMAKSAGALSHLKTAGFAKVILPWMAGISAGRLVQHQQFVVRSAVSE